MLLLNTKKTSLHLMALCACCTIGLISPLSGCFIIGQKMGEEMGAQASKIWFMNRTPEDTLVIILADLQKDVTLLEVRREGNFIKGKSESMGTNFSIEFIPNQHHPQHTNVILRVDKGIGMSGIDYIFDRQLFDVLQKRAKELNDQK